MGKEREFKNTKKEVADFERRMNMEVRRQERLYWTEEKDFKRAELLGKYMAKLLYRWNNRKFKNEYLKKLEKNWQK